MLELALKPRDHLRSAARLPAISRESGSISAAEIAVLACAGLVAALAVGLIQIQIRIPGHAILRAVLPMAVGLSLVPRRSAGLVMGVAAAASVALLYFGGLGRFQPAAAVGLLAIGPLLDLAMWGTPQGSKLYLRFILAGVAANLLAYESRLATALLGWDQPGGRQFSSIWLPAIVSFALCGAIAGLISATACFRLRAPHEP